VTQHGFVCVVRFDDDLPNGPFVEGSAGNMFAPGSFTATVPSTGATWGLVAKLVADSHQAVLDRFSQGGKMKSMGGGHRVGHVGICKPDHVLYKGGAAPENGAAKEGQCTVQLQITDIKTQDICCVLQ